MTQKKFYIISPHFPPENVIASQRSYSISKFLDETIFDIEVVTTKKYEFDGAQNLSLDTKSIKVVTLGYLPVFLTKGIWKSFWRKFTSFQYRLGGLFDPKTLFVIRLGLRLYKEIKKSDKQVILLNTYSPVTPLFLSLFLKSNFGDKVFWALDFRDLWYGNQYHLVYKPFKFLQKWLEKRMVNQADLVTVISMGMAEEINKLYKIQPQVIYNGYLKSNTTYVPTKTEALSDNRIFDIIYTGMLYKGKRDPEPLFHAISSGPSVWRSVVRVHFYGSQKELIEPLVAKYDVGDLVELHPFLSHEKIQEIQLNADCLLFLESNDTKGTLPGKLFEYLSTDKPILAIGVNEEVECGALIKDANAGFNCLNDVDLIQNAIVSMLDPNFDLVRNEQVVDFYNRESQVLRLQKIILERLSSDDLL